MTAPECFNLLFFIIDSRYRGLIVEDHPLRVKFIDFSYEPVQVRIDDVRIIPEQFTSLNPFVSFPFIFINTRTILAE